MSIITQGDTNFLILLFYIFLRDVMVFDKELAILYGFLNLIISKKTTLLEKSPRATQNIFNFWTFCLILYQNAYNLYKTAKFYALSQSRSILLLRPKYCLFQLLLWGHIPVTWSRRMIFGLLEAANDFLRLGKVLFHLVVYFRF